MTTHTCKDKYTHTYTHTRTHTHTNTKRQLYISVLPTPYTHTRLPPHVRVADQTTIVLPHPGAPKVKV